MNTVRPDADVLDDEWPNAVGLDGPVDLEQLRNLRRALRRLAADATDDPREPLDPMSRAAALATVNVLAEQAVARLSWPADGQPERTLHGPVAGVIATLGVELLAGPDRGRLRA